MLRAVRATGLLLPRPWPARCLWATPSRAGGMQPPPPQPPQQQRQRPPPPRAAGSGGGTQTPFKPPQLFKFCRMCGSALQLVQPEGDSTWRHVCGSCSYIDYQNPRMVVGCIVEHEGRILLCRRGIEPQRGLWTVPAGYLECGESSAQGAARETWEEAGARVTVDAPFAHYDIPGISQVYLLFRARLAPPFTFAARQPESLEAALFAPADIPWAQLAFSSVSIALRSYLAELEHGAFSVHHGMIQKAPGSGPNDPGSFQLVDHVVLPTRPPAPSR